MAFPPTEAKSTEARYDFKAIEQKWQRRWEELGLGEVDLKSLQDKFYVLTMFPYPSGDRLHMGHWYQYGIVDSWARFQAMRGKNVFQPMGFDAFGLPAENFAIKSGIHPDISTSRNVAVMTQQFKAMGVSYAWRYTLDTSKPEYYRWTQWVFLQLYRNGLAYRKEAPVNWCPSCQTVLANEQVLEGLCDRCDTPVTQKNLLQWFFRITRYAQRLLDNLGGLQWPERTKSMQRHWIGRSEGCEIDFAVVGSTETIRVFTTRADTLFGVSYLTLAPEHPLVSALTTPTQRAAVDAYREQTARTTELERLSTTKEKSGVFTGAFAVNPLNGETVPIWVSDYVLVTYGSGAVMAVPAHDERDFAFAQKFALPIRKVIVEPGTEPDAALTGAFTGEGRLISSGGYDGQESVAGRTAIVRDLEAAGRGKAQVNFRLRDWLISRQRYWGVPIPIVYCAGCGEVPLPDEALPVLLPETVDFQPTGVSPLLRCPDFMNATCPRCQGPAQREADTMDTFVCSSWYFLRFPNVGDDSEAFDKALTDKMLPVDRYVGGPEHACMHLLYARFVTMVMKDLGHLSFEEPFSNLTHQGLVLGKDGQKMSKSRGNSVSPDPYVAESGSDCLRLYLMFGFNYIDGGPWDDGGFVAVHRYRDRLHRLFEEHASLWKEEQAEPAGREPEIAERQLLHLYHSTIARVTVDAERFQFNTCIARLMELVNGITEYLREVPVDRRDRALLAEILRGYVVLLAPFAPHFAEEHYQRMGGRHQTVFQERWPQANPRFLELDTVTMAVMINGKLRAEIEVPSAATEDQIRALALAAPRANKYLQGKSIAKVILVPKKLINLIVTG
jgi:leucyl-tRNA synthetase